MWMLAVIDHRSCLMLLLFSPALRPRSLWLHHGWSRCYSVVAAAANASAGDAPVEAECVAP